MKATNKSAQFSVTTQAGQADVTPAQVKTAAGAQQSADTQTTAALTSLTLAAPAQTAAGQGKTAQLSGHGLGAPGDSQPNVKNATLGRALKAAFRASVKAFDYAGERRGPDNAYPKIRAGRAAVWKAVDRITGSRTSKETPALKAAVAELAEFQDRWGDSGDEANMPRIWGGYFNKHYDGSVTSRPGLKTLLQNVFDAAKMGTVVPAARPWS